MKKNVLIVGPIGDFGGREVEVNIIARALENDFNVSILSTGYMTDDSFALRNLKETKWDSVPKKINTNNIFLYFFSLLSKIRNKGKLKNYAYLNNLVSKKLFDLNKLYQKEIEKKINESNLVILCMQLTSKFLPEIVVFCNEKKIPCLVRTTGTIKQLTESEASFLRKVNLFIHHSENNANKLNKQINLPYVSIDQCALNESQLLALQVKSNNNLRFGYLGRLSEEKGILPIADFFSKTSLPFIIAGDGDQKIQLLEIIANKSNCEFMGSVSNEDLALFFDAIDVLIIPSYEESGPLVGLEAMAAGKIIISTKVGAMQERLEGMRSFWFQIENKATFQTALEQVLSLNESERFKLSNMYRERYLCKYSLQVVSEKYKKITKQFIS